MISDINNLWFRVQSVFLYLIEGKSSLYIHSPHVFDFTENVLGRKIDTRLLKRRLKALDTAASKETASFQMKDFGKEGMPVRSNSIAEHHRKTQLPLKYAEVLFRIAAFYRPAVILELGTSTGTAAISAASGALAEVVTIDAEQRFQQFAQNFSQREMIRQIEFINASFDEAIPALIANHFKPDLVFIDGNHRYEPTVRYSDSMMKMMCKQGIIVLDDIHWSKEMNRAWKELKDRPDVSLSIDLYRMGILFLGEGERKSREHFRLYYF